MNKKPVIQFFSSYTQMDADIRGVLTDKTSVPRGEYSLDFYETLYAISSPLTYIVVFDDGKPAAVGVFHIQQAMPDAAGRRRSQSIAVFSLPFTNRPSLFFLDTDGHRPSSRERALIKKRVKKEYDVAACYIPLDTVNTAGSAPGGRVVCTGWSLENRWLTIDEYVNDLRGQYQYTAIKSRECIQSTGTVLEILKGKGDNEAVENTVFEPGSGGSGRLEPFFDTDENINLITLELKRKDKLQAVCQLCKFDDSIMLLRLVFTETADEAPRPLFSLFLFALVEFFIESEAGVLLLPAGLNDCLAMYGLSPVIAKIKKGLPAFGCECTKPEKMVEKHRHPYNRRYYKRFASSNKLHLFQKQQAFDGIIINAGKKGLHIQTDKYIKKDEVLDVTIEIPNDPGFITSRATVRWSDRYKDKVNLGIEFTFAGKEEESRYDGFFAELRRSVAKPSSPTENTNAYFEMPAAVIKPLLYYIKRKFSPDAMVEFTGLYNIAPPASGNNWISYNYYNEILKNLIEYTNNPRAPYEAMLHGSAANKRRFLPALFRLIKHIGTPRILYKRIAEAANMYSGIGSFEILHVAKTNVTIRFTTYENIEQTKENCMAVRGFLASFPSFFNMKAAAVKEIQCQTRDNPACIYEIYWNPVPKISKLIGTVGLVSVIAHSFLSYGLEFIAPDPLASAAVFFAFLSAYFSAKFFQLKTLSTPDPTAGTGSELQEAINKSQQEFLRLQHENKEISRSALELSIVKNISDAIINNSDEDLLLSDILQIIVSQNNLKNGFFMFLNNNFNFTKWPIIYNENETTKGSLALATQAEDIKQKLQAIFTDKLPQKMDHDIFSATKKEQTSLLLPLKVTANTNYLLVLLFKKPLKPENIRLDLYDSILQQIEIALDNIYKTRASINIISNLPSSILVFDRNSLKILFVNPTLLSTIKVTRESILGTSIIGFLKITEQIVTDQFMANIVKVMNEGFIADQELRLDNQIIGYTLFNMSGISGRQNEVGMIMKNITEQKEMQDQLIRAEKMAALGTLASGIAHEINNPLYGILGTAEIIRDEANNPEITNYAGDIIEFSAHASDIVKDLSAYSRDLRNEKPSEISINDIIDEVLKIANYSVHNINISITRDYAQIPALSGLKGEYRQIFMNLINNAMQAMKGRGSIKISTAVTTDSLVITVSDSGPGIPDEIAQKIFDPFFTTKEMGKGTGLGLHIVYRLVTKYNGVITVKNLKEGGTCFTIKFSI